MWHCCLQATVTFIRQAPCKSNICCLLTILLHQLVCQFTKLPMLSVLLFSMHGWQTLKSSFHQVPSRICRLIFVILSLLVFQVSQNNLHCQNWSVCISYTLYTLPLHMYASYYRKAESLALRGLVVPHLVSCTSSSLSKTVIDISSVVYWILYTCVNLWAYSSSTRVSFLPGFELWVRPFITPIFWPFS